MVLKMIEKFDIRVPIKDDLRKGLILGLQARLPIGIILGFLGHQLYIFPLL